MNDKLSNMTLKEKGPIMPPPKLDKYPQQVSAEIQTWQKIIAATHWNLYNRSKPDGADFYVGNDELGHIHLDGEIHLLTGKVLSGILIKNKLAEKFPYGNEWVTFTIRSAKDVAHAIWLFRLSYKKISGISEEKLKQEIQNALPA